MRKILNKNLHIHVKVNNKHHPINIGLIIIVILASITTWFLTEYIVYELNEMDLASINWVNEARPQARAQSGGTARITDISFDWSTHIRSADESDNFPITWHSDDRLYTAWGDGWGWQKNTSTFKAGLGVSRISGSPPSLTYDDTAYFSAQGCGTNDCGKSYGIIALGNTLYMWVSPDSSTSNYDSFTLYKSTDSGASWTGISGVSWTRSDNLIIPSILQFGKGYAGVPSHASGYVYSFATHPYDTASLQMQDPGRIYLMRVPTGQIETKSAYWFFSGLDASGNPTWTASASGKAPVVEMNNTGWAPVAVTYDSPLQKYLMVGDYNKNGTAVCGRGLAVYQADRPWGPWTLVKQISSFGEESIFFYNFPSKWVSADGKTLWMVFSGVDKSGGQEWDSFNAIKATLAVDAPQSPPVAPSGLNFTNLTDSTVRVNWTDNSTNEDGFNIYRSTSNTKPSSTYHANPANDGDFTDGDTIPPEIALNCGTAYYYWVEAFNSAGISSPAAGSLTMPACASTCGNGACDSGETTASCPADCPASDTTPPAVAAFDVQPRTTTGSVTASYTVTDNAALARVELWRARYQIGNCETGSEAGCAWTSVSTQTISGTSHSGTITYTPLDGAWLFGLHAVDASGNVGDEGTLGPVLITKTSASANNVSLYGVFETSLTNSKSYSNPFKDVVLNTTFTSPTGRTINFFGFFDGNGSGGQSGHVWKQRFMPDEVGAWSYQITFSDGSPGKSGNFNCVDTGLPGPLKEASDKSWYFDNTRGAHFNARPYDLHHVGPEIQGGSWDGHSGTYIDIINNHMLPAGHNMAMVDSPSDTTRSRSWWYNQQTDIFDIAVWSDYEKILDHCLNNRIYIFPFDGMVHQNNIDKRTDALMRYMLARFGAYASYMGYSPTWEWSEIWSSSAIDSFMGRLHGWDPFNRLLTAHDSSQDTFSDWMGFSMRQLQSRTVFTGNTRSGGNAGGVQGMFINKPIIGSEDIWETEQELYGQPRNAQEVRRGGWGGMMAGILPLYSEWSKYASSPGNMPGEPEIIRMFDFFYSKTNYRAYQQLNSLVSASARQICSGKPGQEYLAYDEDGGSITINLSGVSSSDSFSVLWYDPKTGNEQNSGSVNGGSSRTLSSPFSGDSVLLLKGAAAQTAPNPPSNLAFDNLTQSTVRVKWTDNSGNEDGFNIYRSTSNTKPSSTYHANPANDGDFTDGDTIPPEIALNCGTAYYYWVEAFNSAGISSPAAGSLTMPACASTPVQGLSPGLHTITLTATDAQGKTTQDTIQLEILPAGSLIAQINLLDTEYTQGETIYFTSQASRGASPYTYTWKSDKQGTFSTTQWPTVNTSTWQTGTHYITLTVTDATSKTATDQISITINPVNLAVFKSGFESPVAMSGWLAYTNWYKETTGADQGYKWETDFIDSNSLWNIILNKSAYPDPDQCIGLDITSDEHHSGSKALYMEVKKSCKYNSIEARVSHHLGVSWPYDEAHFKAWLKIPSATEAVLRADGGNFNLNELRNPEDPGALRIVFEVFSDTGDPLQFRIWSELWREPGWQSHWMHVADSVTVPLDQWFQYEVYYRPRTYSQGGGAYWIKVNGVKILEQVPTATTRICGAAATDTACAKPFSWNMIKCYTYDYPVKIYLDDIELYNTYMP